MTRLEILKLRYNQLVETQGQLDLRTDNLSKRKIQERISTLKTFFTNDSVPEGYQFNIFDGRVELRREGSRYDILTLYINESWNDELPDSIEMSMSSFRTDIMESKDNWVSKRFETIQLVASLVEDYGDDILAAYNSITVKYSTLIKSFYPKFKELRNAINEQSKAIEALKLEELENKLFDADGIAIQAPKDSYSTLTLKWDWDMNARSIAAIKALRKTASGKSIDVEIKTKHRNWQTEEITYDYTSVKGVRFDNVKAFLREVNAI